MKRILLFICLAALCAQARILVVVDNIYYNWGPEYKASIDTYVNDIINADKKPAELIVWQTGTGTVRDVCYPLWQKLASEYSIHHHTPATTDDVEGAVFIGSLPIPQFRHFTTKQLTGGGYDTTFFDLPHDGYFMDVWNQTTNKPYGSDLDMWPWYTRSTTVFRGQAYNQFFNFNAGQGSGYNCDSTPKLGDNIADIWVSRVMGEFVKIPQYTTFQQPYDIILAYMNRLHARMTQPANVPPRSFSMSGISSFSFPYPDEVLNLDKLGLPFHAVFQNPDNNPSNLQGQLQAGPRGNTNYGGYYLIWQKYMEECLPYQNSSNLWSGRNRTWSSLLNHATGAVVSNLDTLGYEWAGIHEHGFVNGMGMNGNSTVHDANSFRAMNGNFSSYACSRPVCDVNPMGTQFTYTDALDINRTHIQFANGDLWNNQDSNLGNYPWGYGPEWTGANAMWKFPTPGVAGDYNIYVSYVANSSLNRAVLYQIEQIPVNKAAEINDVGSKTINQQVHVQTYPSNSLLELLGRFTLSPPASYDTTYVKLDANGNNDGMEPGNEKGNPIYVDAVWIVGVAGTPTEGYFQIVDNDGSGFSMNPGDDRTYLEFPVDGGPSKTVFFLANSCGLNEYNGTQGNGYNNLGNLFAMLYNGLISMGSVNSNYRGTSYIRFITELNRGSDFGQAYLNQSPGLGGDPQFLILGAGNLKADAYIPYPGYEQTPYNGPHNITIGATLQAEDFDNGIEMVAYHDNDPTNTGGAYRTGVGVDIEACSAGGYDVIGSTNPGEWMEYTCNVTGGMYDLVLYASNPNSGTRQVTLYQDNTVVETFNVSPTGGSQTWNAFTLHRVTLAAKSPSVLKLATAGGCNLDKLVFAKADMCAGLYSSGNGYGGLLFGLDPPYTVGSEYCKATDGNTSTFYDYSQANGGYTGLDQGTAIIIGKIRYYPRANWASRMVGGKFQGSNTSNSSGFVDLYTIATTPAAQWNEVTISNSTPYRWVRYLGPNGGYCNIAEMEFYPMQYTITATAGPNGWVSPSGATIVNYGSTWSCYFTANSDYQIDNVIVDGVSKGAITTYMFDNVTANHTISATFKAVSTDPCSGVQGGGGGLNGATFGLTPSYAAGSEYCKAADGNTSTFYDYSQASGGYTGLDLGSAQVITRIRYYPRSGNGGRMTGGKFQGSNTSNSSGFVDLYTISGTPAVQWNDVTFSNSTAYRWVRYLGPNNGYCNIAEMEFYASATQYTITASAGANGSISPSGSVKVNSGASQTFTIAANSGYTVSAVTVDGTSQGAITTYTFSNVTANHTIAATFAAVTQYTITASAGTGGTISPSGGVLVNSGASQTFTIAANSGYTVSAVTVDGTSQGAITTYTFSNVTANHTISAAFTASTFPDPNKWYKIATKANTNQCLDVSGGSYANGTAIQLWSKSNVNQEFKFQSAGNGYYTITCRGNTGYSIDMSGNFANNQTLKLWTTSTTNNNQKFKPVAITGGYYRLESYNSGFSIDNTGNTGNGVKPYLWTSSNTNANQQWVITAVQ